jgi:hypothetical protein
MHWKQEENGEGEGRSHGIAKCGRCGMRRSSRIVIFVTPETETEIQSSICQRRKNRALSCYLLIRSVNHWLEQTAIARTGFDPWSEKRGRAGSEQKSGKWDNRHTTSTRCSVKLRKHRTLSAARSERRREALGFRIEQGERQTCTTGEGWFLTKSILTNLVNNHRETACILHHSFQDRFCFRPVLFEIVFTFDVRVCIVNVLRDSSRNLGAASFRRK